MIDWVDIDFPSCPDRYLDLIELRHPVKTSRSQTAAEAGERWRICGSQTAGMTA